jgi:hypothetical protein
MPRPFVPVTQGPSALAGGLLDVEDEDTLTEEET